MCVNIIEAITAAVSSVFVCIKTQPRYGNPTKLTQSPISYILPVPLERYTKVYGS